MDIPKRRKRGRDKTIAYPAYSRVKQRLPPRTAKTAGKIRYFRPILNSMFTVTGKKSGRGLRTAPVSTRR